MERGQPSRGSGGRMCQAGRSHACLRPPAFEIKDIQKEVVITSCHVGGVVDEGDKQIVKVIIDAELRKNINFKTLEDCDVELDDGVDAGNIERARSVCGDVRHCFV